MANLRELRKIGGIINSTDLNYNFQIMQEDLQGAIQGLIFNVSGYGVCEYMADRDAIPQEQLVTGMWCSVSEEGKVYEYHTDFDVKTVGTPRTFGPNDGDLPTIPYVTENDPSSGEWLNGWYICKSDKEHNYEFESTTLGGMKFNHGDWAVWCEIGGTYKWKRVPKWVEIMNVTSILEQGLVGKLKDLHTEAKDKIVNAINEIHDDLGTLTDLTTTDKSTAIAAINELDKDLGAPADLKTENKDNVVNAVNEVHDDLGTLTDLTTANKSTAVGAINELDGEMGDLSSLHTEHKATIVGSVNEVHDDLGTLNDLTTTSKNTAVSAINELDKDIGVVSTLKTENKTNVVSGVNEIHDDLGTIGNLTTTSKDNAVAAINELKAITDTLKGAYIFIGKIDLNTEDVTQAALTAKAKELTGKTTLQTGWVIVDKEQHEWYYNDDSKLWVDMEQPNIYPATNSVMGTVIGSATGDISITDGVMTVNHAVNSDKLGGQLPDYYATKEYTDTKANKVDVLEKTNTTAYTPTADYHPATKKYVDEMSENANWGKIIGDIESQEDLMVLMDERPTEDEVLTKTNTLGFVPTLPYQPATKDYVDNVLAEHKNWGQIEGDIADQIDLQNELLKKQDVATAWNTENLVVGTEQPEVPASGYIVWIDTNS